MSAYSSDSFAWGSSFLTRIDPRIKICVVAALLGVNIISHAPAVPVTIIAAMLGLLLAGRIPYRRQLLMIAFPITFALFAVATQTVFAGSRIGLSIGPFDLHPDGFLHGLFLSSRIIAGGLVVVILGVSTPLNRLCVALGWFRVPVTFIEVVQLTYRYLFDIYAEFARMKDAQTARLGWSSPRNGLFSSRMLGGSLFLRVYDRGVRSAEAMRCRGDGPVTALALPHLGRLDIIAAAAGTVLLALLIALSLAG